MSLSTIETLEKSYRNPKGLGSIPIAGRKDAIFLDVAKETEKAVQVQYLGKLCWLPKSAFYINPISETAGCNFFSIKKELAEKLWNNAHS